MGCQFVTAVRFVAKRRLREPRADQLVPSYFCEVSGRCKRDQWPRGSVLAGWTGVNMQDYADQLFKKALPLIVALIACVGGSCFAIFAPEETIQRGMAIQCLALGIVGTFVLVSIVRKLWQQDPDWDFMKMRRNLVILLLCLCWGFGAVSGFILFYLIPRHIVG